MRASNASWRSGTGVFMGPRFTHAASLPNRRLSEAIMHVFGFAAATFLLGFLVHWIWWRVRMPTRRVASLLAIFVAALPCGIAIAWLVPRIGGGLPWDPWSLLHVAVFHVAMTLAYVVLHEGLDERSPSMRVLICVAESGGAGRTQEELYASLAGASPVESRLAAMVRDGMLVWQGTRYRITSKGRAWAAVLGSWRRLVGLRKGG